MGFTRVFSMRSVFLLAIAALIATGLTPLTTAQAVATPKAKCLKTISGTYTQVGKLYFQCANVKGVYKWISVKSIPTKAKYVSPTTGKIAPRPTPSPTVKPVPTPTPTRLDDQTSDASMEQRKKEGYF